MKHSAGILIYREVQDAKEVLLVHPGGPFYSQKDLGVWSIPKGEYDPAQEDALEVAKREFEEETGNIIICDSFIPLSQLKTKGGKLIRCWAAAANFDPCFIRSNFFEMEWPPKSGKIQSFPETDKAGWFSFDEARKKINASQIPFINELELKLRQMQH